MCVVGKKKLQTNFDFKIDRDFENRVSHFGQKWPPPAYPTFSIIKKRVHTLEDRHSGVL